MCEGLFYVQRFLVAGIIPVFVYIRIKGRDMVLISICFFYSLIFQIKSFKNYKYTLYFIHDIDVVIIFYQVYTQFKPLQFMVLLGLSKKESKHNSSCFLK